MSKRYLVVSDLHMCDVEDHPDGWKAYKGSRYLFDESFSKLLNDFTKEASPGDQLTLVLNGDIFDFDLVSGVPTDPPWPVSRSERARGLRSTAVKSAWKLELVLSHHVRFVLALSDFLARGHQLVYVFGNHDRELYFPEVRRVLLQELHLAARGRGDDFSDAQVRFEPWFFYVPGEIYAEHGQQYDHYNSFRNPLCPVVEGREGPMLALPMGNLSNRFLMTKMGFFNPFATDYILNIFSYLWHWFRHYAISRRSLLFPWFLGSIVVLGKLLATKKRQLRTPKECPEILEAMSTRPGLKAVTLDALQGLQQPPITNKFYRMAREFWLDRVVLFLLMVGGTITLALAPIPLWVKLMVPLTVFPLFFFVYESIAHGETVFSIVQEIPRVARAVARLLDVQVVAFGHDHVPRLLPIDQRTCFVDTGTWAPILDPRRPGELAGGYQNYLIAEFGGDRIPRIIFGSWMEKPS